MKKSTKQFASLFILFLLTGILLALLKSSETCTEGETTKLFCEDKNTIGIKTCKNSKWVSNVGTTCAVGTSCYLGQCLSVQCSGTETTTKCSGDATIITQTCENGIFKNVESLCPKNTYCDKIQNQCLEMPETCGNYACDSGETKENCWRDCGGLSDWTEYYDSARDQTNYAEMTKCTEQYNCNTVDISKLSERIIKDYTVITPKQYIDAVIDYSFRYGFYNLAGGYAQDGESATDVLKNADEYGQNCVDYTVLTVALLRQKGIMAQQEFGIVGVKYECKPLAFQPPGLERLGNIAQGQVYGHSWVSIWTNDKGWVNADPTVGITASKCVNYRTVGRNSEFATAYIPNYENYL